MSITSCKSFASVEAQVLVPASGGTVVADTTINYKAGTSGVTFTDGTGVGQVNKAWQRRISLSASTPVEIDLTALTGGTGDINFAAVKLLVVENFGSSGTVTVGGGATNPFLGPLGGTTPTVAVNFGTSIQHAIKTAAGWATSGSVKTIKFDPGSTATTVNVIIFGI